MITKARPAASTPNAQAWRAMMAARKLAAAKLAVHPGPKLGKRLRRAIRATKLAIKKARRGLIASTSGVQRRVRRSMALHAGLLAANQFPKGPAAALLGYHLGGPAAATAALAGTEIVGHGLNFILGKRLLTRRKVAAYLKRRSDRPGAVYKGA